MTFLAPWAMVAGALGAVGAVLLHLVARQRPAAFLLPTARFIPDRQSIVSRAAARPRDLLLLACRVLVLLLAGAAFAQPVLTPRRTGRARVVLLDRSALVADPADAWRRARALAPATLIGFDTSATLVEQAALLDSSSHASAVAPAGSGSITAAIIAARRAAASLAPGTDSVELVLISPIGAAEIDDATASVRALWPGAITVERIAARRADTSRATLDRTVPLSDALGPALTRLPVLRTTGAIRVVRAPAATAADSVFARAGGALVLWDSTGSPLTARGLAAGGDVIVAALGARVLAAGGLAVARWADGTPAAVEQRLDAGCIRTVDVYAPVAGDLALRPAFQRIVRGLVAPCAAAATPPADSATVALLAGDGRAAPASALADASQVPSRLVPWLLAAALLFALLELGLRRVSPDEEAVT